MMKSRHPVFIETYTFHLEKILKIPKFLSFYGNCSKLYKNVEIQNWWRSFAIIDLTRSIHNFKETIFVLEEA